MPSLLCGVQNSAVGLKILWLDGGSQLNKTKLSCTVLLDIINLLSVYFYKLNFSTSARRLGHPLSDNVAQTHKREEAELLKLRHLRE